MLLQLLPTFSVPSLINETPGFSQFCFKLGYNLLKLKMYMVLNPEFRLVLDLLDRRDVSVLFVFRIVLQCFLILVKILDILFFINYYIYVSQTYLGIVCSHKKLRPLRLEQITNLPIRSDEIMKIRNLT